MCCWKYLLQLIPIPQFSKFVKCTKIENRYYIDLKRNTICRFKSLYIVFFDVWTYFEDEKITFFIIPNGEVTIVA